MDGPVSDDDRRVCRRCGAAVVANAQWFDVFEQMHYTCFHYEFEHRGDPDVECTAGGCPAAGISMAPLRDRIGPVEIVAGDITDASAVVALRRLGFDVTRDSGRWVVRLGGARLVAEGPLALLGLVKLAETGTPWRATADEVDDVLAQFPDLG